MTTTLEFTASAVNPEVMSLILGIDPAMPREGEDDSLVSLYFTTTEEVSGEPRRPAKVRGLLAWIKGTNRKNLEQYHRDHMRWVIEGKPSATQEVRTFIPRARIEERVDNSPSIV